MRFLETLSKKKEKLVVGLMSGTSADGISAVLVKITGRGPGSRIHELAFKNFPYPRGYTRFLLRNSDAATARLDEVTRLNMLVAELFADAVRRLVRAAGRRMEEVDLIGSHGQTIQHLPAERTLFGKRIRGTLQIGSVSVIAKRTGIVTVGDFRVGDIAVGGSGAPLVPILDYYRLRSRTRGRLALNIGGIANMTVLPRNCSLTQVLAFDSGPGNMIIDALMQRWYGKPFDTHGALASSGNILPHLLNWMLRHPYLKRIPPKSTGRELFGEAFLRPLLSRARGYRRQDVVATVTEFTALSIYQQYLQFVRKKTRVDELLISGGGVKNRSLVEALSTYFNPITVRTTTEADLSSDAKEAICFALLANETIAGNPGNVPGATGARRRTVLGAIALP